MIIIMTQTLMKSSGFLIANFNMSVDIRNCRGDLSFLYLFILLLFLFIDYQFNFVDMEAYTMALLKTSEHVAR